MYAYLKEIWSKAHHYPFCSTYQYILNQWNTWSVLSFLFQLSHPKPIPCCWSNNIHDITGMNTFSLVLICIKVLYVIVNIPGHQSYLWYVIYSLHGNTFQAIKWNINENALIRMQTKCAINQIESRCYDKESQQHYLKWYFTKY